jgi:hypothetical protein
VQPVLIIFPSQALSEACRIENFHLDPFPASEEAANAKIVGLMEMRPVFKRRKASSPVKAACLVSVRRPAESGEKTTTVSTYTIAVPFGPLILVLYYSC